ncbi:hypothetical protein Pfo_005175 [Paulownia fortunei]|nr:hypothetical protein Pfo_005175 [Paulownia fortunei]
MARGGKIAHKRKTRNKVQLEKTGSDVSDEDYMVGEDEEFDESEDEYCSSLADDESEESLGEFEEEEELEEEWVKKKIKKVGRPRGRKSFQERRNNGVVKPRKKKAAYSEEEEEEDYDDDDFVGSKRRKKSMLSHNEKEDNDIGVLYRQDEDDFVDERPRNKTFVSSTEKYVDHCNEKPRKKTKVSYREEKEDGDYDDCDEDDDEEFTPDEVDSADDDEELPVTKRNKVDKLRVQKGRIANGKKRKRNAKALKRTKRKKPIKEQVSRRNNGYHGKEFRDESPVVPKKKKITEKGRGRKSNANSDSDIVSSGSSDFEYTMSEEEREQIREASEFCRRLTTSLRSSSSLKMIEEEEIVPSQRKRQGRKGKEKVVDEKIEVGKQVCGICLSEEGNRTVRGILNCCSHYFCFACIMEWSKVESRCPLCKQRFATISRTARADGGRDLRDAVIPVPERDQVYQPSEEELRGYLDPYESVLCSECHQGGDDALMLLCDLCDSPAHTYCVGLGREVPEGNWYCDGCRPTALASSNAQALNPTPDHGANNNLSVGSSPVGTVRETFDLNELYVPESPLTQVMGHSPSPRYSIGDFQAASPASGSGAFTLYERRRIQRQIHQLLNNRSRQSERSDGMAPVSGISLFGSQICRDGVLAPQHAVPVQVAPQNIYHQGRLPDYTTPSLYGREVLSPGLSSLRGQVHQASTSMDHSFGGLSHSAISGTDARIGQGLGHQQLRPCNSRSNTGADASLSPYQFREVSLSSLEKEQVQSMVRSHLKSLSRNLDLGYITFKYIARTSTHTILAAVGLEHRWNEVYPVRTRPLICDHFDGFASRRTYPVAGQCSSCFDWFVRNVVREIMSTRAPLLSTE